MYIHFYYSILYIDEFSHAFVHLSLDSPCVWCQNIVLLMMDPNIIQVPEFQDVFYRKRKYKILFEVPVNVVATLQTHCKSIYYCYLCNPGCQDGFSERSHWAGMQRSIHKEAGKVVVLMVSDVISVHLKRGEPSVGSIFWKLPLDDF